VGFVKKEFSIESYDSHVFRSSFFFRVLLAQYQVVLPIVPKVSQQIQKFLRVNFTPNIKFISSDLISLLPGFMMQLLFVPSDQLDQPASSESQESSSVIFLDLVVIAGTGLSLIRCYDILEEEMASLCLIG
jgi:hypothetical protein